MPVVMKGGTSGCREDYLAPTPSSGQAQPLLDTSVHGEEPASIYFKAKNPHVHPDHYQAQTPDFMPVGGAQSNDDTTGPLSGSTDLRPQDISGMGPNTMDATNWAGAPNTGLKGGPAVPGR